MATAAAGKKKLDFYKVLGVPKGAGDAQIKSAYRKLAIQYHPDKTAGDEELGEKFKQVSAAYAVLSDPAKRRQYDSMGDAAVDLEALDMEQMTFGTTLLAALFSKLGAPIPTAIPQRTLDLAQDPMARSQGQRIEWGTRVEGKIATHGVQLYFGEIGEAEARSGVRIYCNSAAGSKFKLLWFDRDGRLLSQEDSQAEPHGRGGTSACITLAAFGAMHVDPAPPTWKVTDEDEPPPVFRQLETLASSKYSPARPGEVLLAVQGDNFFRDVRYTVTFSRCDPARKGEIEFVEAALAEKQGALAKLEQEYWDAKERYERVLERVEAETEEVETKLLERSALYASMAGDEQMEGGARQALKRRKEARAKANAKKEQAQAAR